MAPVKQSAGDLIGRLDVNDLVRVNIAGSSRSFENDGGEAAEEIPTRIEDIQERCSGQSKRYVIAAPRYSGDVELPASGTVCTLEWPGPHGIWILPGRFIAQEEAREGLKVWMVEVIGPPRQNERRSFVRVGWTLPIVLEPLTLAEVRQALPGPRGEPMLASPESPGQTIGETSNISEGGLLCALPLPGLAVGTGVRALVTVGTDEFVLPSRVTWIRPTGSHGPFPMTTALAFDDAARHGDRLRPLLFAEQLRIRRAGLA